MVVKKAISMPRPAISPSSESPRKSVGKNEKKAHAVAAAASAKGMPAFFAALRNATWQIVDVVTFRAISDAELKTEINTQANKQNGKRN